MKHSIFLSAAALSLAATFISCASSKKIEADSYGEANEEQVTAISINAQQKKLDGDHYSPEKLAGNDRSFGEKLFNLNKYTKLQNFSLYAKPVLGGLGTRKGVLIYREGTDIAGFECYYDSCAYAVQFATAERKALIKAFEQYQKDFDEKKLDRKDSKSRQAYGFVGGYEDFGNISASMQYYCKPKVYFGYNFVSAIPYFCIYVKKAENLAVDQKKEGGFKETVDQSYYFTKAQAKVLCDFLSEENINSLREGTTVPPELQESDTY